MPGTDVGATWQTIEIRFLSDFKVQIHIGGKAGEVLNYGELGFADGRLQGGAEPNPNRAWCILRAMADKRGTIADMMDVKETKEKDWQQVEKRMQEIRRVLRTHFKISQDPIPFIEGTGYEARFKIGCAPSYHS